MSPLKQPTLGSIGPAIKMLLGIVALLPSAVVLLGLFDIPPSLKQLLTMIVTVLGLLSAALVLFLSGHIVRLSKARTVAIFVPIVALGCIAAVGYYEFARAFVIHFDNDPVILPLHYEPRVAEIINSGFGGDVEQALMSSNSRYYIYTSIERTNDLATLILILLLSVTEVLLVAGLLGAIVAVATELPPAATGKGDAPANPPKSGLRR